MSTFIAKHEIHDMINFDNDKDLIADKKQENAMFMLVPACRGACARFTPIWTGNARIMFAEFQLASSKIICSNTKFHACTWLDRLPPVSAQMAMCGHGKKWLHVSAMQPHPTARHGTPWQAKATPHAVLNVYADF